MQQVDVLGRSHSIRFSGTSWLFANLLEFTPQSDRPAGQGQVHGIAMEAFGGPSWWDRAEPTYANCLGTLPAEILAEVKSNRTTLLLDMSNEGQPLLPDWIDLLHRGLETFEIPPQHCTLLQQNRALPAQYAAWAAENQRQEMAVAVYDHFPRRLTGLVSREEVAQGFDTRVRQRLFCCLNFTPRPNRVSLVSWLLAGGFDRLGFLSMSVSKKDDSLTETLSTSPWFPERETVERGLEMLKSRAPLLLDLPPDPLITPEYHLGPANAYAESYFSIVAESEVSNGNLIRITEKSLKPFIMMHPMIILGNPGSLGLLRDLGFDTCPGFFNDSYDSVLDPTERSKLVLSEISRMLSTPHSVVHDLYLSHRDAIIKNYILARRYLNEQYKIVSEPEMVSAIVDIHNA